MSKYIYFIRTDYIFEGMPGIDIAIKELIAKKDISSS
jgi:hypothetical protein